MAQTLRTAGAASLTSDRDTHDNSDSPSSPLLDEGVRVKKEAREEEDDLYDESDDESEDEERTNEFVTKKPLGEPTNWNFSIKDIIDILNSPWVELNPNYQRGVVWSEERMSGLISSLLEDFYVPPIIFNIQFPVIDGVKRRKRICVDGKQRLTSIREFMNGNIPVKDKWDRKWFYQEGIDAAGSRHSSRRILPETIKAAFRNKRIVCYEYEKLTHEQEEDLFARVQKGMALNTAEMMRATTGPWQSFARIYELDFPSVMGLIERKRSAEFRIILACFSQIYEALKADMQNKVPSLKASAPSIRKFIENKDALNDNTKRLYRDVFTTFSQLVEQDPMAFEDRGWDHAKKFAPVEVVCVAVLIALYQESRTKQQMLKDIRQSRDALRKDNIDLRLNAKVWRDAWNFIDAIDKDRPKPSPLSLAGKASDKGSSENAAVASSNRTSARTTPHRTREPTGYCAASEGAESPPRRPARPKRELSGAHQPPALETEQGPVPQARMVASPAVTDHHSTMHPPSNIEKPPPSSVKWPLPSNVERPPPSNVKRPPIIETFQRPPTGRYIPGKTRVGSGPNSPSAVLVESPRSIATASPSSQSPEPSRKRRVLDLGTEINGARTLASKKARF
ncbi:MAG: hypothetical protein M1819_004151 [Sarea resinae]|nr:MAG: hypothetical protein M1819_004151 [Sarea resinae]